MVHRFSGLLSAFGMGLADVVSEAQEPSAIILEEKNYNVLEARLAVLSNRVKEELQKQGFPPSHIQTWPYLNLRFQVF